MLTWGQSRYFDRGQAPSGLPRSSDVIRPPRHVGLVPKADMAEGLLNRVRLILQRFVTEHVLLVV